MWVTSFDSGINFKMLIWSQMVKQDIILGAYAQELAHLFRLLKDILPVHLRSSTGSPNQTRQHLDGDCFASAIVA
jgi:hypothetical protein